MAAELLALQEDHVFDAAARFLARSVEDRRHNYLGHLDGTGQGRFPEGWRFPLVEGYRDPAEVRSIVDWNEVTFVYRVEDNANHPHSVRVIGGMNGPRDPIPLTRVGSSRYWAVAVKLPTRRVYDYLFLVDGQPVLDPINTRRRAYRTLHNPRPGAIDEQWSYFWTDYCQTHVVLETWEGILLQRFTRHILPFNSLESRIFLQNLDSSRLGASAGRLYRLDLAMGVVNYIDKVLAGAERHHLAGYRTCLQIINGLLRSRNPYQEPRDVAEEMYELLYREMASNTVPGWNTQRYANPSYFLGLLRRHTFTGAFCHPKYGGNAGAYAWDYLTERFGPFDWRQGVEKPWGTSEEYFG